MKVLIVEDEKRLAQALGQIMEEQNTVWILSMMGKTDWIMR